jgi:hypothetical protein
MCPGATGPDLLNGTFGYAALSRNLAICVGPTARAKWLRAPVPS